MCDSCDEYDLVEHFQALNLKEVREYSGDAIAELAKNFRWNEREMEKFVDEIFSDRTTLSRIAHLLLFTEMIIDRYPDEKLNIYETTFKSLARNLRF